MTDIVSKIQQKTVCRYISHAAPLRQLYCSKGLCQYIFSHTEFSPYRSAFIFWQRSSANTAPNTPTTPKHQQPNNQKRPPRTCLTPKRDKQILTCPDCMYKAKIRPQALCFWSAAAQSSSDSFISTHPSPRARPKVLCRT